ETANTEIAAFSANMDALKAAAEAADKTLTEKQADIDDLIAQLAAVTGERDAAKTQAAKLPDLEKQAVDLAKELEAAKSDAARLADYETQAAELTAELETANVTAETLKAELDAANAAADKAADLENRTAQLTAELETTRIEAAKAVELETQIASLNAELEAAKAESEKVPALSAQLEAARAAAKAPEEAAAMLQTQVAELETQVAALNAEIEASAAVPPAVAEVKHGLGMVTGVERLTDATDEKNGTAQVNTTVCSLTLDAQGKIRSVTWDVQQTMVQFDARGKVTVPEEFLTKLEKGDAYNMRGASAIGKEWFEQIEAFAAFAVGKTVEEVMNIPVVARDADHTQVPDVEAIKASVTITVGDYLASLQKAAEKAK
ncbi:MAG: hypothetical protein PHQ85_07410, partial [Eubacteriales bacterium]|nr:hypothetical protein [Eubacteriales bacterium]